MADTEFLEQLYDYLYYEEDARTYKAFDDEACRETPKIIS